MWTCKICEANIEDDSWQNCWRCSVDRNLDAEAAKKEQMRHQDRVDRFLECLRCDGRLTYDGTRRFREDDPFEFRILGYRISNQTERFDVYHCPVCGKVEFFVDGVGDAKRGEIGD